MKIDGVMRKHITFMRMFHENYMEFIPILRNILLKKECLKES
jgi:hypothetical protein